jgi:hypothetical protein
MDVHHPYLLPWLDNGKTAISVTNIPLNSWELIFLYTGTSLTKYPLKWLLLFV